MNPAVPTLVPTPAGDWAHTSIRWAVALLFTVAATLSVAWSGSNPTQEPVVAFVGFTDDVTEHDVAVLRDGGATELMVIDSIDTVALTATPSALQRLAHHPDVRGVRRARTATPDLAESVSYIRADMASRPQQHRAEGRMLTRPALDGSGVTIAVVDSGISALHPDFAQRILGRWDFELSFVVNGFSDSPDDDLLQSATRDEVAALQGLAAHDDNGHGTGVAGVAAGSGSNWEAASGVAPPVGVAPGANLVDVRVYSATTAQATTTAVIPERNIVVALDWLVRHHDDPQFGEHGIQVVNNSWSLQPDSYPPFGSFTFDPVQELVEALAKDDVIVVFSAGNAGGDDDTPRLATAPQGTDAVLTVAASCSPVSPVEYGCGDGHEGITDFSSRGVSRSDPEASTATIDVAAPGHAIITPLSPGSVFQATWLLLGNHGGLQGPLVGADHSTRFGTQVETRAWNLANYFEVVGTSFAAPHVTGAVALLLQLDPTLDIHDVRDLLTTTARPFPNTSFQAQGHGLVDVEAALRLAQARMHR